MFVRSTPRFFICIPYLDITSLRPSWQSRMFRKQSTPSRSFYATCILSLLSNVALEALRSNLFFFHLIFKREGQLEATIILTTLWPQLTSLCNQA